VASNAKLKALDGDGLDLGVSGSYAYAADQKLASLEGQDKDGLPTLKLSSMSIQRSASNCTLKITYRSSLQVTSTEWKHHSTYESKNNVK
jgi:hypothetical protein